MGLLKYLNIKNFKTVLIIVIAMVGFILLSAQDPRESHYYYEILGPNHESKPKVEGFAQSRIKESLNKGLVAVKADDSK